ncbi:MAG TPA: gamma-glutamyltransferase family protein [Stellaceae bacterium]|nr:gamma-glutamyltransferase family protein [Stellaceae bacterium]
MLPVAGLFSVTHLRKFVMPGRPAVLARGTTLAGLLLLGGCAGFGVAHRPSTEIVAAANPLAAQAGLDMLKQGGSAVDAAIATQMVLGVVEPQSSGLGGGSLVVDWDGAGKKLATYDGLARASHGVPASIERDIDGRELPEAARRHGGLSVGVPGTLRVLWDLHEKRGKLAWAKLFDPAIVAAEQGFQMPRYLHTLLASDTAYRDYPALVPLYFAPNGKVVPEGTIVRNPELGRVLRRIASEGPDAFYKGKIASDIVTAVEGSARPGLMTTADLASYRSVERPPLCGGFVTYKVCTMGPPSFGGVAMLELLGTFERTANKEYALDRASVAHLYVEAGRLAEADRQKYVGDPDQVQVPIGGLLDPAYLDRRAALVKPNAALTVVEAGALGGPATASLVPDTHEFLPSTSQIAVVDRFGNTLSMTTTVNLNFGSHIVVDGFILNDAMINFAPTPPSGKSANGLAPDKRPATSMTPTIAFDAAGDPILVGGSAGGGEIVDYVAQNLVDLLARDRSPAEAAAAGHLSTAKPQVVELEQGTSMQSLAQPLQALGHTAEVTLLHSGTAFLKRSKTGWIGAADPRRDGTAAGD